MRNRLILIALAALIWSGAAGVRAADSGSIIGRIEHGDTGEGLADVEVTLTIGRAGRDPEEVTVMSDAKGRYSFRELETGQDVFYTLDARYDGGLFPGSALNLPDDTDEEPEIETTIKVWETIADPDVIIVARNDLFVVENEGGEVGVIEAFQITNTSDRAYIGRGAEMGTGGEGSSSLGFALPPSASDEGVRIIDASLDIPQLVQTDFGFGITSAIPPGRFSITYSYSVPGTAASFDLSRRVLYPTVEFSVFSSENLELTSNRLQEGDPVEIQDKTYVEHSSEEPLDAGDPVQIAVLGDAGAPIGLLAGMAGVLVLVALLGIVPFIRSKRPSKDPAETPTREQLLRSIAELDLSKDDGRIDDETWARERAKLKTRLKNLKEHR